MKLDKRISPSSVSRDFKLKTLANGSMIAIGGKITSAREDAASIVDAVCKKINCIKPCLTESKPFPWAPIDYLNWQIKLIALAFQLGVNKESAICLMRRHGFRAHEVFKLIEKKPDLAQPILPDLPFIWADLIFCAQDEMVMHLDDLLRRRMPLLILSKLSSSDISNIAHAIADALNWNEPRLNDEIENCFNQT